MLIIKCDCEIFIKKWNFLRIEPGFRDPETSTIELQPVTHISGDIDFDYSSKQLYQALIYNFYRILKGKLVLSRDAFIASRERMFLGIYLDTVLSHFVYFLAKYEWAFRVNARRSESESHVFSESSYIHD